MLLGRLANGLSNRMALFAFGSRGDAQQTLLGMAIAGMNLCNVGLSEGERACLVKHDRIDLAKQLKCTTIFD